MESTTDSGRRTARGADALRAVFPGESEMARRCRAFDWEATPLGSVAGWPASLRTVAAVVVAARQPMFLWWGPALVQLYNDGYRPSLGADRHPAALGAMGRAFWADAWPAIGPDIEGILAGGPAVWYEDRLVPIERDGRLQDVYWSYGYTPVPDDAGRVGGVLVTVVETTARVRAHAAEAERARLAEALAAERTGLLGEVFRQAPSFLHVLSGPDFVIELANAAYYQLVGHRDLIGRPAFEAMPEAAGGGFPERIAAVMATGEPFVGRELPVTLARTPGAPPEERFVDLVYLPLADSDGTCTRVLGHGVDVTEHVLARRRAEGEAARLLAEVAAERGRLHSLVLQLPVPVALHAGPEHRYALVNDAFRRISGGRDVTGLSVREAFPTLAGQGIWELFDRVYATGEPWVGPETRVRYDRLGTGVEEDAWFDLRYEPVRDAGGRVTGILNVSSDVTEQVRARHQVEGLLAESERARVEADAANALLQDQGLELELSNQQLQEQAVELEMQAEELHATTAELEERTEEAEAAGARVVGTLEAMADGYFALDADFRIVAVNAAMERGTGLPRSALLGRSIWEAFPGTLGTAFEYHFRRAVTERVEAHFTHDYSDGRLDLVVEEDVYPAEDGGLAAFWRDITARVRADAERERLLAAREAARAAAAASDARYRSLAEAVPVQVWTARPDGQLDFANGRTAAYFGVSAGAVLGGGWGAFVHPDDLPAAVARWSHAVATGTPYQTEFRLRAAAAGEAAGAYRWHLARALPERDASGAVVGWVGSNTDVEDERAARAEAEEARIAAEAANRAKAEFLATMSHELRTPLNAIGGYAELLELGIRGPVTEQQRADLARIQQSQRHLLGLVNEVLDLAKVDAGALRVERAAVRAGDTADAALALVRPQAAAKRLRLSEACEGAADRPYLGDEPRVRQVLVNLLANAVKFTGPGGRVAVTCALTDAPPGGAALAPDTPYVALCVEDTGPGIAADQLGRIFEPFTQAEGGLTRQRGGTGLGLAISRRLARLMGGDLTVESRPGAGSAFTLWLPTPERRTRVRRRGPVAADAPASAATVAPERPTPPPMPAIEAPGLARVGEALVAEVGPALRTWVARLRADAAIPAATGRGAPYTDAELEDHAATFITDVALALRTMGQAGGEPAALLRDGTAIMALIAERHGAQRARLGWPEAAVAREFALLAEVLDAAVRRLAEDPDAAAGAPAAERATTVVADLLRQAARRSLGGYRLATAVGAT